MAKCLRYLLVGMGLVFLFKNFRRTLLWLSLGCLAGLFWFVVAVLCQSPPKLEIPAPQYVPVVYKGLSVFDKKKVPPMAKEIYVAVCEEWQVGEWAYCFKVPATSESALRRWLDTACPGEDAETQVSRQLAHISPVPEWWRMPADAQLLCHRELRNKPYIILTAWYCSSQNTVWLHYSKL